jgi:hypothetical protein
LQQVQLKVISSPDVAESLEFYDTDERAEQQLYMLLYTDKGHDMISVVFISMLFLLLCNL